MCHRTTNHYTYGHSAVITTRCRGPWSTIIPKGCLQGFILPVDEQVEGLCTGCAIKRENEKRREQAERERAMYGPGQLKGCMVGIEEVKDEDVEVEREDGEAEK